MGPPTVDPIRQALLLTILMLLTPWAAADTSVWQGPSSSPDSWSLDSSNSTYDGFIVPSNFTITDSNFEIEPEWVEAGDNGTYWAPDTQGGFSVGVSNGTSSLNSNGDLTLATQSSYGQMTDFETSTPQFTTWAPHGDEIWLPVNLSNVAYGPTNATSGHIVAGSNGSIPPGSQGYIRSKFWPIPDVVKNFNLTFDRWNSFDSTDDAQIQYSIDNGQNWQDLDNWTGNSSNWVSEAYSLDSFVQNATNIGFRYLVTTSNNSGSDIGLFIDSFNLSNQGEPLGAWFHGNSSGQYSVNADGSIIVPINLSGYAAPLEFVYSSNWDIEGDYNDNMVVMISLDNNTTWTVMSPLPGVPGLGIPSGGTTYNQQTYGWRDVQHPFPSWAAGHVNASHALLKFRVTTDGVKNHGGSAIDGWEGIMIDDLRVLSSVGSPNMKSSLLENFSDSSTTTSLSVQGYANDWQYITWEGHNGPWSESESFESVQLLPSGWRVEHERGNTPWETGAISNAAGYGPNSTAWPSGNKGMGISLDGVYSNNIYSHLVSPIYHIPIGSSARLTFSHWVCTEAAWDGGAIFTSIDEGVTWQHFGDNITGFYERLSQVNSNSPFYGHGIFDGSTVNNGCGTSNVNHTFSRVSGDISSLAGNNVQIRFSFFSDAYVEEDGWYIDDAGIEIDRFQTNGTWVSPLIEADEAGWARMSSLYWVPEGTAVTVDVLDVNDNVVEGHENLELPFNLEIAAWKYSHLKFRVELSTDNETITPRIRILHHGITEYLTLDIIQMSQSIPEWVTDPSLAPSSSSEFNFEVKLPSWRPYGDVIIDCAGNASASLTPILYREPILSLGYPSASGGSQPSAMDEKNCGQILVNSFGPAQATTLQLNIGVGETFEWFKLEPITLRAPINPAIDLGDDGVLDWKWNGTFHHTSELYSLEVDGVPSQISEAHGFELNYSSSLEFSILLPARNLTDKSWDCVATLYCYNGGINFITNGSQTAMMSENLTWINNSGFSHHMSEYRFSFIANQSTSFSLLSINYFSGFNHSIILNQSLSDFLTPNEDGTSTLPVMISAQRGGVKFDGAIDHEKAIVDSWVELPNDTFRPGFTQQAISNHQILQNTPDLDSVNLKISTGPQLSGVIAEVTIDNLANGGRFIQNSGAGVLSLDSTNSSWDGENVTWSFESKWLLDDHSRLYWFVTGINGENFSLGPVMGISGSGQHAASTNDLEVIELRAWSDNRSLHDFADPLWPLNVKGDQEIIISGEVRFSGLNGIHPLPQDVDLMVSMFDDETEVISNSVTVDEFGIFNTTMSSPNLQSMSGSQLKIIPSIVGIGVEQSNNANDATSASQEIRFVLDSINAEVIALEINAPGGNQLADGHIWHMGQDIPLQLHVSDDNGLPSTMELFYNRSGRGWESINFLTPLGSTSAVIDLPLIDEASVPLPGEETGWLDVFIVGNDLAGNPIENAGDFDEPYARINVQPRYATWISGDSLNLDRVDNYLLPGNTHRFNFTISDDNGIESIDSIRLDLAKDENRCDIEWIPWSGQIIHDVGCFIKPPSIQSNKHWQTNTWDVLIDFELRWDLEEDIGSIEQTPSLRIWDENAPLGAGFTSIDVLSWSIHSGIDLQIIDIQDKVAPLGEFEDKVVYLQAQDIVDIEVLAYHMGYEIPANNLPFSTSYVIQLIGNNNSTVFTNSFNSDGSSTNRIVFDSAYYGTQIKVLVDLNSLPGHNRTGDLADVVIDDSIPTITVSSGYLVIADSDELDQVPIEVTMQDGHGLNSEPIVMYWNFIRQGRLVEGTSGSVTIPVQFESIRSNLYSAVVDMNTSSDLQKGDGIIVWFDGSDASGQSIEGGGTSDVDPIYTLIQWMAYEPILGEIIVTPYRPNVGDIISVDVVISNIGLIDGSSQIVLLDGDGQTLDQLNLNLTGNTQTAHTFEIEAWKEGDLGLLVRIDNQPAVPIPISDVKNEVDDSANSQGTMLGLAVLSVFIAGLLLILANVRRNQPLPFDEEE